MGLGSSLAETCTAKSSMHPALFIDEIIRYIFDICSEDGRSSLISLARCCASWRDPALDIIWVRLSSIVPLLKLIPSVVLKNGIYVSFNLIKKLPHLMSL